MYAIEVYPSVRFFTNVESIPNQINLLNSVLSADLYRLHPKIDFCLNGNAFTVSLEMHCFVRTGVSNYILNFSSAYLIGPYIVPQPSIPLYFLAA